MFPPAKRGRTVLVEDPADGQFMTEVASSANSVHSYNPANDYIRSAVMEDSLYGSDMDDDAFDRVRQVMDEDIDPKRMATDAAILAEASLVNLEGEGVELTADSLALLEQEGSSLTAGLKKVSSFIIRQMHTNLTNFLRYLRFG